MSQTFFVEHPTWPVQPAAQPARVAVHFLQDAEGRQHLIVEAPNWPRALVQGPQAALAAWEVLSSEASSGIRNPSDPDGVRIWLLRPGFPLKDTPAWQDSFAWYAAIPRNSAFVFALTPVPGTARCDVASVHPWRKASPPWGLEVPLQYPKVFAG